MPRWERTRRCGHLGSLFLSCRGERGRPNLSFIRSRITLNHWSPYRRRTTILCVLASLTVTGFVGRPARALFSPLVKNAAAPLQNINTAASGESRRQTRRGRRGAPYAAAPHLSRPRHGCHGSERDPRRVMGVSEEAAMVDQKPGDGDGISEAEG